MKSDIVEAFSLLVKEKNMDKEVLSRIIEDIFLSMIKKQYGTSDNFNVFVNMDKGEIEIYQSKSIVEEVVDPVAEIDLESAKEIEPDLELGEEYIEFIDPAKFGRRLIISAKQNLNQRIKEVEKEHIFDEFKNRVGEILSGDIRQINRDEIFLNAEGVEVVLPKNEQIPNERYRRGENLRAVIKDVRWSSRGPEIVVSRSAPSFLIRLFELEVPEIYDGIIEVKGIAREAGDRTKIAVYSNDKRIDAVGACVGMKGMRIQAIVKELNNEKIDIINWSSEPEIFITRSLSPAKPKKIALDQDEKSVIAVLADDQISLAIGKGGQNRRLAAKLTGYDIQTIREDEYAEIMQENEGDQIPISVLEELGAKVLNALEFAGYETIDDLLESSVEDLTVLPGVGIQTAEQVMVLAQDVYDKAAEEAHAADEDDDESDNDDEEANAADEDDDEPDNDDEEASVADEDDEPDDDDVEDDAETENDVEAVVKESDDQAESKAFDETADNDAKESVDETKDDADVNTTDNEKDQTIDEDEASEDDDKDSPESKDE